MLVRFAALASLVFCVWTAGAQGGEEMQAMRGGDGDGVTRVEMPAIPRHEGIRAIGERDTAGVAYMDWKDTCARAPLLIAGRTLDLGAGGGFALVRPYVFRPEPSPGGFYELLLREFARK